MKSMGFRCWKDRFAFVVLEGPRERPILVASKIRKAPSYSQRGEFLAWVRTSIGEVLDAYEPDTVAYKAVEGTSRTKDMERGQVEGVMQEAVSSHGMNLEARSRLKSQIKRAVGFGGPARYVNKALPAAGLAQLDTDTFRDAALAALCRLAE